MADIQGTSLHYFIYKCIAQTSSVSARPCIDQHAFMVSFLSEMNYFATLPGFSDEKIKPIKRTDQFISPIKNLRANVLFNHGSITPTGITYKKISCYMRDSACRWVIVENAKIYQSYVKHF